MVNTALAQLGKMQVILIQTLVAVTAAQWERQEEMGTLEVLVENQIVMLMAAAAVAAVADMVAVAAVADMVQEEMALAALAHQA